MSESRALARIPAPPTTLMGLPVCTLAPAKLVDVLVRMGLDRGTYRMAAYLNAHVCNLAANDRALRGILASVDLLYADGMAVVWANRLVNGRAGSRASAAHFLESFCWAAAGRGLKLAFIGGAKGVAANAAKRLATLVPSLKIVAVEHGYFDAAGERDLRRRLRTAQPDVILCGLGSPRQELVAERLKRAQIAPLVWCVGALFEYFGSGRPRAPRWMRDAGLEWAFRFAQEPARLFTRYTVGNAAFALRVAREIVSPTPRVAPRGRTSH